MALVLRRPTTAIEDAFADLPHQTYEVASQPNFTVRVIEYRFIDKDGGHGNGQTTKENVPFKAHAFNVDRNRITANSQTLKKMLHSSFGGGTLTSIDLLDDNPIAMEAWFGIFHDSVNTSQTFEKLGILEVWHTMAAAHKYSIDAKAPTARAWFAAWYETKSQSFKPWGPEDHQALMLPCYTFHHPRGFAVSTRYLAYNFLGHITERRPAGFHHDHLRLDNRMILALNAAKGRLKTILHRELYSPIEGLLNCSTTGCTDHPVKLFEYELALTNTGAWPVERVFLRFSINDMLKRLSKVSQARAPNTSTDSTESALCNACTFTLEHVVDQAITEVESYFDGLCLDCMNKSKFGTKDRDYWRHADQNVEWDRGCGFSHGQPTWYFSFMGRKEKQIEWQKKKK